jgi:hypothetical protein
MKNFTSIVSFRGWIFRLKNWKFSAKVSFIFIGIASTVWFLLRVIPKPSRATYPCMRAAAPIMSGFIVYVMSLTTSVFVFRKFGKKLISAKYYTAAGLLVAAITLAFVAGSINNSHIKASQITKHLAFAANSPVGIATGFKPGRVVWVYNKDATNKDCTNSPTDFWFMDENTDQSIVDDMLADGIKWYAGVPKVVDAWDSLFHYFNTKHGKGDIGYVAGEKIMVKVNMTNMGTNGRDLNEQMDVTPQLMLALLDELIDSVGVAQADITIGDPYRSFADFYWDKCHTKYPNVHYLDPSNAGGRTYTLISAADVFFSSNTDAAHIFSSRLPQAYLNAAYLINMPCMKTHESAGITLAAKNHQGSVIGPTQDQGSQGMTPYLHYDYPDANHDKMYRHIVDYMAHSKLGGNTLVYIVDAIWSGRNWEGYVDKFGMPPFSGDFTSSLFVSQDPVATESVGYDFLFTEYNNATWRTTYHGGDQFPLYDGIDDYMLQAADSLNWPAGIHYDPDHAVHQAHFKSLGVYEHWNNSTDKEYSRNLGTGNGIELVKVVGHPLVVSSPQVISNSRLTVNCYPNPVNDVVNIEYTLETAANVNIDLYSINGSLVASKLIRNEEEGAHIASISLNERNLADGQYICRVTANTNGKTTASVGKIQYVNGN